MTSIRVVKAFAREDYELRKFESQSLENVMKTALAARSIKAKLTPLVEVIVAAGTCLVLWYGARLSLSGQLSAGVLVMFLLYLGNMYKPMRDLSKMTDTVSRANVGFERIQEALEIESAVRDLPHARKAPKFKGKIELDHVDFSYDQESPVLKDITFEIKPGQVAAFVGPSGTGKTTVISLIPRFYDPVSGLVKIDGADIRRFQMKSLRDQISFVLQDTLLFRAPVWENIAYGKPGALPYDQDYSGGEVRECPRVHRKKCRRGYDTMLGERGVSLSGGQRCSVSRLPRAIIRDTPILILDEPTSGLDAISEEEVIEALDRLMKGRTTILIAHHLGTIRNADVIFVIKDCELVEQGTHEELLAKSGVYAEMYKTQTSAAEIKDLSVKRQPISGIDIRNNGSDEVHNVEASEGEP